MSDIFREMSNEAALKARGITIAWGKEDHEPVVVDGRTP